MVPISRCLLSQNVVWISILSSQFTSHQNEKARIDWKVTSVALITFIAVMLRRKTAIASLFRLSRLIIVYSYLTKLIFVEMQKNETNE